MTWLSYLAPIVLYRAKTKLNTLIEIRQIFGVNKLDLNGYPQSNKNYARNWNHILSTAKIAHFQTRGSALVLGLGGGDIARLLSKLKPSWHQTLVELESEVVEVAEQYFGITEKPNRSVVTQDAKAYMKVNTIKYDLVVVDLYTGDNVPGFVTTSNFLMNVSRALKPKGVAVFNYASHSFRENDFESFEVKLNKLFPKVMKVVDWGHTFFLVYNDKDDKSKK